MTGGIMTMSYSATLILIQCFLTVTGRELQCTSSQSTMKCFAQYFKGDQDCFPSSLIRKFPILYSRDGNGAPERPSELTVSPFEKPYSNGKYYLGVHFSVQPPRTASVNYVKGFEVRISTVDVDSGSDIGQTRCIVFYFSPPFLNYNYSKTKFSVDIYPLSVGLASFRAYSLPKPPTEEDTMRMFRETSLVNFQYGYKGNESYRWSTSISYSVDYEQDGIHGSVWYSFVASVLFNFPSYQVKLYMKNVYYPVRELTIPRANVTGSHVFTSLLPGEYEIKIQPYDPSKIVTCVDGNGLPRTCTTTRSRFITISDNRETSPVETTSQNFEKTRFKRGMTSDFTTTGMIDEKFRILQEFEIMEEVENHYENSKEKSDKKDELVMSQSTAVIIGSVVGVILLIVLTYCGCYRKRSKKSEGMAIKYTESCYMDSPGHQKESEFVLRNGDEYGIQENSLVVGYTADNSYHEEAVRKLGIFLQEHLGVTVYVESCPPESDSYKMSSLANFIASKPMFIFVNSPLAYYLYNDQNGISASNGVKCLMKHLEHNESDKNNTERKIFISVAFDYPHMKQFVKSEIFHPETFTLLEDMERMINCVSQRMTGINDINLPLSMTRYYDELEETIKLAICFYLDSCTLDQKPFCCSHYQACKTDRPLDSISSVLQVSRSQGTDRIGNNVFHDIRSSHEVRADIENFPSVHFQFNQPSDPCLPDDIPMQVIADDIEKLNDRNLDFNEAHFLFDDKRVKDCHKDGYYGDEECISVGSIKSV